MPSNRSVIHSNNNRGNPRELEAWRYLQVGTNKEGEVDDEQHGRVKNASIYQFLKQSSDLESTLKIRKRRFKVAALVCVVLV